MSHSRKDACGGHARREIVYGDGHVTWNESTKNWAKRFKHKQARRHNRMSIRDLEVLEPAFIPLDELELDDYDNSEDWEEYLYELAYDDRWDDYNEPDDWYDDDRDHDFRDYGDDYGYGAYSRCPTCGRMHYDGDR